MIMIQYDLQLDPIGHDLNFSFQILFQKLVHYKRELFGVKT